MKKNRDDDAWTGRSPGDYAVPSSRRAKGETVVLTAINWLSAVSPDASPTLFQPCFLPPHFSNRVFGLRLPGQNKPPGTLKSEERGPAGLLCRRLSNSARSILFWHSKSRVRPPVHTYFAILRVTDVLLVDTIDVQRTTGFAGRYTVLLCPSYFAPEGVQLRVLVGNESNQLPRRETPETRWGIIVSPKSPLTLSRDGTGPKLVVLSSIIPQLLTFKSLVPCVFGR